MAGCSIEVQSCVADSGEVGSGEKEQTIRLWIAGAICVGVILVGRMRVAMALTLPCREVVCTAAGFPIPPGVTADALIRIHIVVYGRYSTGGDGEQIVHPTEEVILNSRRAA